MRLVAQRTKQYAGQDDVVYDSEELKYPKKASVTVHKIIDGQKVPFTASARWAEYVQTDAKGMPIVMWERMPYLMLGKCAESLALRKAFPNELSGIYSEEEMGQSKNILEGITPPVRSNKPIEVVHGAPDEEQTATPPAPADPGRAPSATPSGSISPTGPLPGPIPENAPEVVDTDPADIVIKPDFKAIQEKLKNDKH
jgi:hypothetical protein